MSERMDLDRVLSCEKVGRFELWIVPTLFALYAIMYVGWAIESPRLTAAFTVFAWKHTEAVRKQAKQQRQERCEVSNA